MNILMELLVEEKFLGFGIIPDDKIYRVMSGAANDNIGISETMFETVGDLIQDAINANDFKSAREYLAVLRSMLSGSV